MSSSVTVSNHNRGAGERRSFPREALKCSSVLLIFGENNWGKVADMSESGMAFEFDRPPLLRERVNFTFQGMGCMPVPADGGISGESFEAAGEVIWIREFERRAGVQFVNLTEETREQIPHWLSLETSANSFSSRKKATRAAEPKDLPALTEVLVPLTAPPETPGTTEAREQLAILQRTETPAETADEAEAISRERISEVRALDNRGEAALKRGEPEAPGSSYLSVARLTLLVVSGCFAAYAVTAGARIFMGRASLGPEAGETAAVQSPEAGKSGDADNVSGAAPSAVTQPLSSAISSEESGLPFQVEVLDANSRRWMLWFVHKGSKNGNKQVGSKAAEPLNFSAATTAAKREQPVPAEKQQEPRDFTLVAPKVSHSENGSSGASNLSAEAPALQTKLTGPSRDPLGDVLAGRPVQAPAEPRLGGMVQQARLIRSSPPIYPQLAKSTRSSGDVVVEALIDTAGNVTTVKVISGPVLLQQAAIETVRQWKYEPARLDGQAVPMHLSVTVRFRIH